MNIDASNIVYEDNHLIVVNKPAGILVQGDKTGDKPLIDKVKEFLVLKYNKPGAAYVGMVHRIDRPTSGCVLFTKTSKALPRMQKLFADRQIKKVYWALTTQRPIPESDTLVNYILKSNQLNRVDCYDREIRNSKYAELTYRVLALLDKNQLLEVELITGRKHQIRAQLNKIGCSVVGDLKYGYQKPNADKSICLHCKSLSFIHPVSKEPLSINSELPDVPEWSSVLNWQS